MIQSFFGKPSRRLVLISLIIGVIAAWLLLVVLTGYRDGFEFLHGRAPIGHILSPGLSGASPFDCNVYSWHEEFVAVDRAAGPELERRGFHLIQHSPQASSWRDPTGFEVEIVAFKLSAVTRRDVSGHDDRDWVTVYAGREAKNNWVTELRLMLR